MKAVSVIIPTFNRADRIGPTIVSVLNQDYPEIEIIVVDDGSTDSTELAIRNIADKNRDSGKRIRYFRQKNQGACVARNRGMMLATGSYIMFLDSDDFVKQTLLSTQVRKIESDNTQCSICDFECIDAAGNTVRYCNNDRHPHAFIRGLVSPSISAVLMRRDSIPPGLQWNARLKRIQDVDFMYKYFASVETWSYVRQPLFQYFLHDAERISDSYTKGIQYSVLRKSFKHYLLSNKAFVTTDPMELIREYTRRLLEHQFRNALVRFAPVFFRNFLKNFRKAYAEGNAA